HGRRRSQLLAATLLLGFWGFSIREFALAAPLAVLAAMWFDRREDRPRLTVAATALLGASGALYLWRSGLPGAQALSGRPARTVTVLVLVQGAFTVSLGLVPALVWSAPGWWR